MPRMLVRARVVFSRLAAVTRIAAAAVAACSLAGGALAGPAFEFSNPQAGCGASNVEGFEFELIAGVTVSALGGWDYALDGLQHAMPVGLYDGSCQLVASVTVPAGTEGTLVGQFRYVPIAPIDLSPGSYRMAALIQCPDNTPQVLSLDDVSADPAVSITKTRRIAFGDELACPTEEQPGIYVLAANFLIGEPCGNGLVELGEECDDGDTLDGDCCSATCTIPTDPCRLAGKSQLLLKDDLRHDGRDEEKLVWKWTRGEATSVAELADPTGSSDYALCLYDAQGLRVDAEIPADPARWSAVGDRGFRYRDQDGVASGVTKVSLRASSEAKAKAQVSGKGAALPIPALGELALPLSLELRNQETGLCLESAFDEGDVVTQSPELFKARRRAP